MKQTNIDATEEKQSITISLKIGSSAPAAQPSFNLKLSPFMPNVSSMEALLAHRKSICLLN